MFKGKDIQTPQSYIDMKMKTQYLIISSKVDDRFQNILLKRKVQFSLISTDRILLSLQIKKVLNPIQLPGDFVDWADVS